MTRFVQLESFQLRVDGDEKLCDNEEFMGQLYDAVNESDDELKAIVKAKLSPEFRDLDWSLVIT